MHWHLFVMLDNVRNRKTHFKKCDFDLLLKICSSWPNVQLGCVVCSPDLTEHSSISSCFCACLSLIGFFASGRERTEGTDKICGDLLHQSQWVRCSVPVLTPTNRALNAWPPTSLIFRQIFSSKEPVILPNVRFFSLCFFTTFLMLHGSCAFFHEVNNPPRLCCKKQRAVFANLLFYRLENAEDRLFCFIIFRWRCDGKPLWWLQMAPWF